MIVQKINLACPKHEIVMLTRMHPNSVRTARCGGHLSCHAHPCKVLSVPFACVGSGDPVRVLRLYTTNTLDTLSSIYC